MASTSKSTFDLSLYLCTYNVCTRNPEEDLSSLLGITHTAESNDLPDLYGIGLQEVNAKPYAFLKDSLFEDPWTSEIRKILKQHNYVKIRSERLQGLVLILFAKRYHVTFIRDVKVSFTRTGLGGLWGNKGGVTIRFTVYGCSICIINSHLAAHEDGLQNRLEDHDAILDGPMFRECEPSLIMDHELAREALGGAAAAATSDGDEGGGGGGASATVIDSRSCRQDDPTHYVFWIGDLNFRIELDEEEIEQCIATRQYSKLWQHDELLKCVKREDGFHWFTEGPLSFPPTYKFDIGTHNYVKVKGRRPAWCDRVLWLVNDDAFQGVPLALKQRHYTSHSHYVTSDHKPVSSHFSLTIVADFNEELVKFHPIDRWFVRQDAACTYTVREYANTSAWDWIGVYKSDFSALEEYLSYVYSVGGGERRGYNGCEVTIPGRTVTQPGTYRLCYVSSKRQCILGMSRAFQVVDAVEQELQEFPSAPLTSTHHAIADTIATELSHTALGTAPPAARHGSSVDDDATARTDITGGSEADDGVTATDGVDRSNDPSEGSLFTAHAHLPPHNNMTAATQIPASKSERSLQFHSAEIVKRFQEP